MTWSPDNRGTLTTKKDGMSGMDRANMRRSASQDKRWAVFD